MREIKFRAWIRDYPLITAMCQVKSINFESGIVELRCGAIVAVFKLENVELMQYTRLKDKNDVEIYEGDIVKADMDFGPGGMMEQITNIYWDECTGGWQFNYFDKSTIEVIGNIYENPELLEGSA